MKCGEDLRTEKPTTRAGGDHPSEHLCCAPRQKHKLPTGKRWLKSSAPVKHGTNMHTEVETLFYQKDHVAQR